MSEMTCAEFKATRERLGLTSHNLANILDVNQSTITTWEAGISPIPDHRARQLSLLAQRFDDQVETRRDEPGDVLFVPRNDSERKDTSTPARWQRQVALAAARESGKRIMYSIPGVKK